jgi:hypothetical protein
MRERLPERALEHWVRLRFAWYSDDPWTAAIGAAARLMEAGMSADDAVAAIVRIAEDDTPKGMELSRERR